MMDLCDSDRWLIIICHIGQLWENVWYNTSVFNFLKILIIIFPFLNYQFSVLFLLLSHITHLLFFFLFHHALYISNSRNSHVIFLIFFLFLFYLPFLTSSPCFFFILFIYLVTHHFLTLSILFRCPPPLDPTHFLGTCHQQN